MPRCGVNFFFGCRCGDPPNHTTDTVSGEWERLSCPRVKRASGGPRPRLVQRQWRGADPRILVEKQPQSQARIMAVVVFFPLNSTGSRSLSRDQGSSQITTCLIVFSWGGALTGRGGTHFFMHKQWLRHFCSPPCCCPACLVWPGLVPFSG